MVDWSKIKSLDDLSQLSDDELYDTSRDGGIANYPLMPGLTDEEKEDAEFWRDYLRGIMLITGMPGQGKGMFAHMLAFKLKRYFGLTVVSDTRPRPLFGKNVPFSHDFLVNQLDRMFEVATGRIREVGKPKKDDDGDEIDWEAPNLISPHVADDGKWISSQGEVFIRRAIWLLDEFGSKYMNRREPNNPIHRTLLFKIFPIWRHLESIIVGMATEKDDLDPRCEPKLTTEVRCTRLIVPDNPERLVFGITLYPLRYVSSVGELEYVGQKIRILLDGDEPRDCLGGKSWKDLYNTKQAVAIEAPNSLRNKRRQ